MSGCALAKALASCTPNAAKSRPLFAAQLTFTVVNTGGLVETYGGPQTYFRVVNALPTPTPYCQFTPITRPSADPIIQPVSTLDKGDSQPHALATATCPCLEFAPKVMPGNEPAAAALAFPLHSASSAFLRIFVHAAKLAFTIAWSSTTVMSRLSVR